MRYIVIDPTTKTIFDGDHPGQIGWREIVELIGNGCTGMDCAGRLPNGDLLWVDGEGLLKDGEIPLFQMPSVNIQPLGWRGVITGPERLPNGGVPGEDEKIVDAQTTLAGITPLVIWVKPATVTMRHSSRDEPGLSVHTITPVFHR